jgi:hypothetical protein
MLGFASKDFKELKQNPAPAFCRARLSAICHQAQQLPEGTQ